jgi:hypothetical protein
MNINLRPSRKSLALIWCLCIVLLSQPRLTREVDANIKSQSPAAAPLSVDFYRSLTDAIDHVDGHLTIELNKTSERWKTHVDGTRDLEWKFDPSAPQTQPVMEVFFKYKNGLLQAGQGEGRPHVEFKPGIVITILLPNSQSSQINQVLTKIYFDENGYPVEYAGTGNVNGVLKPLNQVPDVKLAEHLRFAVFPVNLFSDGPFKWVSTPLVAGASGPFIKKMSLPPVVPDDSNPGLEISLKDNATVTFSKRQPGTPFFDNAVTVSQPSRFAFKSLTNDFLTKTLDGKISSLDFNLHSGQFNNEGLDLRFDEGARLRFKNLEFHDSTSSNGNSSITATEGVITGNVVLGSKFILASGGGRETIFSVDAGSILSLDALSLEISNQSSAIKIGGGSKILLNLAGGRMPLASTDYMLIKNGMVSAEITAGKWQQGLPPAVSANISLLACEINSGVFSMRPGVGINIRGGLIRGTDLKLNSASSPALTGRFSDVTFDVEDGTTFEIPGRFIAVCRSATRLVANNPGQPFSISTGLTTASGYFRAVIPFWTCYTPPSGSPVIRDSMLKSTLILNGSGSIGGTDEIVDYTCCAK